MLLPNKEQQVKTLSCLAHYTVRDVVADLFRKPDLQEQLASLGFPLDVESATLKACKGITTRDG